jgi:hypothetical protein
MCPRRFVYAQKLLAGRMTKAGAACKRMAPLMTVGFLLAGFLALCLPAFLFHALLALFGAAPKQCKSRLEATIIE